MAPIAAAITKVVQPKYPYPIHFYIVHEAQPNAFAAPGGNIYVVDSMFYFVHNTEELAGTRAQVEPAPRSARAVKVSTARPAATTRNSTVRASILAISAAAMLGSAGAAAEKVASVDLLSKAADPNPGLSSYTAAATLSAELHALVPVHKTFTGTVYYLKPRRKIVFENVSGPLSRFRELEQTSPSYEELSASYAITPLQDDGTTSAFMLVAKKSGSRVANIQVKVDDASQLATQVIWNYANGGSLRANQKYTSLGSYHVLETEDIAARFPDYSVDGTLQFSNYQLNAAVDPSIFAAPSPS